MWQTAYPVGVFKLLGIDKMIITNAAGGIGYNDTRTLRPGDLVCVTDQIKLAPMSPLRGANIEDFGPRFFDMQSVFDPELRRVAENVAAEQGFSLKEGVYAYMAGPQYETPAEIRALKLLGANLVGMSTVAENIFAAAARNTCFVHFLRIEYGRRHYRRGYHRTRGARCNVGDLRKIRSVGHRRHRKARDRDQSLTDRS